MVRVKVLDPTATPPDVDPDPGPDAGRLAGKVVGLRLDTAWRSYEWVLDEWTPRLEAAGATVRRWVAGNRVGDTGEQTLRELATFAAEVDVGIVGLGN
jgi:hypothetical protein